MSYRDTWIEVDLDCFNNNLRLLKEKTNKELFCVIKANAYGHGDIQLAREAIEFGCAYLVVSSLDEAMHLRNFYKDYPILCIGFVNEKYIDVAIKNNITLTATSLAYASNIIKLFDDITGLKMHIKVDTGMNRLGMKDSKEINETIALLKDHGCLVEGIYTHFHSADNTDKTSAYNQRALFHDLVSKTEHPFTWIHSANSDASLSLEEDPICNACRVGLAMYGLTYVDTTLDLQPVLSLYTVITHMKEVNKGETIGYGATYTCDTNAFIATLPIGYGDGFIRLNQGRNVYCNGSYYPIVGRVCMDQCMIRCDAMLPLYTKVELIGKHMPISDMADKFGTISYEILCILSDRIPRKFIKNKQIIKEIDLRNYK